MTKAAPPEEAPVTGLALLRQPFPAHQISKLPKETKKQREEREADRNKGVSCTVCGGWHHKNAVHLDYVGHAALTDRLLDVDPEWSWEPAALRDGLPAFDATGGLWIKLTVCGVSRLGYGHAAAKPQMDPGAREKEVIGDALRNAAMRFGAALDLWHKGDLHAPDEAEAANDSKPAGPVVAESVTPKVDTQPLTLAARADALVSAMNDAADSAALEKAWALGSKLCGQLDLADPEKLSAVTAHYEARRDELDTSPFQRDAA
jgi:hypothetical protein